MRVPADGVMVHDPTLGLLFVVVALLANEGDPLTTLVVSLFTNPVMFAEKVLDAFGLQYTSRRVEEPDGSLQKCIFSVPPVIPARVSFRVDYPTGLVTVALVNVDRLERVTLEFHSTAMDESVLEDLVRLILGRDSAFLRRAPLAGLRGPATG